MNTRATANLPSRDFHATESFYALLGFETAFKSDGWMILKRGGLELEFFFHPKLKPAKSWFSACFRTDRLDELYISFQDAGLPSNPKSIPRLTGIEPLDAGIRAFYLVDLDGSLIRCIEET